MNNAGCEFLNLPRRKNVKSATWGIGKCEIHYNPTAYWMYEELHRLVKTGDSF